MKKLIANIDEILGRFYGAQYELEISDEELEHFNTLPWKEKEDYIKAKGQLIIDIGGALDIDKVGDISDIVIKE